MTYCQSITQIWRIIWVKCIPLSLRSKARLRATLLLPTWFYSCRSGGTVSCAVPSTKNMTISTSISQTFRSWVAIFHLRQPMAFLSHSSYGMTGLAPRKNVLFWASHDLVFPYNKFRQGYVMAILKSSLRKLNFQNGDLILKTERGPFPSGFLHCVLGHYNIQWHILAFWHCTYSRTYYITRFCYRIWPLYWITRCFHRPY